MSLDGPVRIRTASSASRQPICIPRHVCIIKGVGGWGWPRQSLPKGLPTLPFVFVQCACAPAFLRPVLFGHRSLGGTRQNQPGWGGEPRSEIGACLSECCPPLLCRPSAAHACMGAACAECLQLGPCDHDGWPLCMLGAWPLLFFGLCGGVSRSGALSPGTPPLSVKATHLSLRAPAHVHCQQARSENGCAENFPEPRPGPSI